MAGNEGTFTGTLILRVVVIAVIVAVIATFLQRAIFGDSNPAITGAVASAVAVITLMAGNRRRQERLQAQGAPLAPGARAESSAEPEDPRK